MKWIFLFVVATCLSGPGHSHPVSYEDGPSSHSTPYQLDQSQSISYEAPAQYSESQSPVSYSESQSPATYTQGRSPLVSYSEGQSVSYGGQSSLPSYDDGPSHQVSYSQGPPPSSSPYDQSDSSSPVAYSQGQLSSPVTYDDSQSPDSATYGQGQSPPSYSEGPSSSSLSYDEGQSSSDYGLAPAPPSTSSPSSYDDGPSSSSGSSYDDEPSHSVVSSYDDGSDDLSSGHPHKHVTSSYDSENDIFSPQSEQKDEMADVFRALNLPTDFASSAKKVKDPLSPSGSNVFKVSQLYMTGNPKLDKIMNCPCYHSQLEALGVEGYAYQTTAPSHYGPQANDLLEWYGTYGHGGQVTTTTTTDSSGGVLASVLRLLLTIPSLKLTVLQPLLTGITGTAAQATNGVATFSAHVAKQLPGVATAKADVVKKLIETAGTSGGSLLSVLSDLISSAAAAKMAFSSDSLPHAFEVLGGKSERVASTVGNVVTGLSGTTKIITSGVRDAAKAKGKLVSSLVSGGQEFKSGVLDGIRHVSPYTVLDGNAHHHHY